MVATQHQAASEAGARVLAEGGNAVDGAIAASLALATVEPWMSGLGGGGYMLVRPAGEAQTYAVSFGMVAPGALDPADYPLTGEAGADLFGWPAVEGDRNMRGPLAVAVPGQVAGLALARERFGSWGWADLVAPACALAERGMEVDWHATVAIAASAPELAQDPGCAATYLADGFPLATPWTGDAPRIHLGSLAETLRRLAEAGPADFYTGEIARAICADMAALGGRLSTADLANYEAQVEEAPATRYRDALVSTAPGLTAGPTLIDVLNRLAASLDRGAAPPGGEAYCGLRRGIACRLRRASPGHGRGHRRRACVLHEPSRRRGPGRHRGRADPDPAFPLRRQGDAAADRDPDEQRHHVVRPPARRTQLDRSRQAAALQHVPRPSSSSRTGAARRSAPPAGAASSPPSRSCSPSSRISG